MHTEIITIRRRPMWSFMGDISVGIECDPLTSIGVKIGLGVRAAIKTGAVLTGADLRDAVLRGAVLRGAVLRGAVLTGADLRDADLRDAVLRGAVLRGADLTGADLRGADLTGADLRDAVLRGAVLRDADLRGADLTGADLTGAVLTGADLRDAVLRGAVLRGEKMTRIFARVQREIDPYTFMGVELEAGGYKIGAGCRWFTDAEFRAHVASEYPDTDKAEETLAILDFIAARARALDVATG